MVYCVRKLAGLLLSWVCSIHAIEIPEEEKLEIFSLSNGVKLWLREQADSSRTIACRMVAYNPCDEMPQIFSLDCPSHIFEDELPYFVEYCRESIKKQASCRMGLMAVGDFDGKGLREFLADALDVFIPQEIGETTKSITILPTDRSNTVSLSLFYPTADQQIKNEQDIKQLWILHLLQSMCQERFHKALAEIGAEWIPPEETRYFLPFKQTVAHGKQVAKKDGAVEMLFACLQAMQKLKGDGFTEAELHNAKAKLHRNLMTVYQPHPDNIALADYYAAHFAYGAGCPGYDTFMMRSIEIISDISMVDMAEFLGGYFKDESRRVEIKASQNSGIKETDFEGALDSFKTDLLVFEFEPVDDQPVIVEGKDALSQLPVTEIDKQLIYEIIDTMAANNPIVLGLKSSELKKKGRKINHVHPMKFLEVVFANLHLKTCMGEIKESYFKWNGFISGISQRLEEEFNRNNLLQYVPGLCQTLNANPEQLRKYIQKHEWENMIKYLIKL